MAFRKTYRSNYFPSPLSDGFGEVVFSPVSEHGGNIFHHRNFRDASVLSDESLPLTDLKSILDSGSVINGNVSFRPSDPALVESRVMSTLTDFIDRTNNSTPDNHES